MLRRYLSSCHLTEYYATQWYPELDISVPWIIYLSNRCVTVELDFVTKSFYLNPLVSYVVIKDTKKVNDARIRSSLINKILLYLWLIILSIEET